MSYNDKRLYDIFVYENIVMSNFAIFYFEDFCKTIDVRRKKEYC